MQAIVGYWRKHKDRLERKARGEQEPAPEVKEEAAAREGGDEGTPATGGAGEGAVGASAAGSGCASSVETPAPEVKKEREEEEDEEDEDEEEEPSHSVRFALIT